jgi:hypothetical protein
MSVVVKVAGALTSATMDSSMLLVVNCSSVCSSCSDSGTSASIFVSSSPEADALNARERFLDDLNALPADLNCDRLLSEKCQPTGEILVRHTDRMISQAMN